MQRAGRLVAVRRCRYFSTASTSSFNVDLVSKDYVRRTEWAGCNYGNSGPQFNMVLPPPNVTGKLHLGHALTVAVEDAFCRHHRIKGGVSTWRPGFDHAGIATQSVVERMLWNEKGVTRASLSTEEFLKYCREWSEQNSATIRGQLQRLGATLDWNNCYYTLDDKFSSAVTRAFCELHDQQLIYRDHRLVNWCPALKSSLSDQEVDRVDVSAGSKVSIPCPSGGKRQVEVGRMYTVRYPTADGKSFVEVGTTRPETIFADVALAVNPSDSRHSQLIGSFVRHPLLADRLLPVIADEGVIIEKGTGVLKITPAHDFLDFEVASRHWKEILDKDSTAATRACLDDSGKLCDVPEEWNGIDRFDARTKVVERLNSLGLLGQELRHEGAQISVCSRTGDIIEPRLTHQWFMDTRDMHLEAEKALKEGKIRITPSFHEGKLMDWLANQDPWCLSRQLDWGHRIPAYHQENEEKLWITAKTREQAVAKLGTAQILQDSDVLDTWFSSSLVPLVSAGWMEPTFDPSKIPLNLMETGWDILGFWVVRMMIMTMRLSGGQVPFGEVVLHGLIRDPNGKKMSKSLGNVIDPLDVLDGISLEDMLGRLKGSSLNEKEIASAGEDIRKRYPNGIPKAGADALRFALLRHDVLATDISLNVVDLAGEGMRFCNKLWNLVNYMETVSSKCNSQKEVDSEAVADRWIISRLSHTLATVEKHMSERAPHLAFSALHQFILGNLCDVYLETTKKALWNEDARRLQEIRSTLTRVVQPTLVQLSVFMPFVTEHLYEKVFRREPGSIYFDFVKASMFAFYRDEELEGLFGTALAAVSAVRSIRQQLQLPAKMEFEGVLVSKSTDIHEMAPVLSDLAGLRVSAVLRDSSALPKGFIPCNLPGSDDILALKIEDSHRADFIARLRRLLEKTEQRQEQFMAKAAKYKEIAERERREGKVKPAVVEKSVRKSEQAASVAQSSSEEVARLKALIASAE